MILYANKELFPILENLPSFINNKLYFPNIESMKSDYITNLGYDKNFKYITIVESEVNRAISK